MRPPADAEQHEHDANGHGDAATGIAYDRHVPPPAPSATISTCRRTAGPLAAPPNKDGCVGTPADWATGPCSAAPESPKHRADRQSPGMWRGPKRIPARWFCLYVTCRPPNRPGFDHGSARQPYRSGIARASQAGQQCPPAPQARWSYNHNAVEIPASKMWR